MLLNGASPPSWAGAREPPKASNAVTPEGIGLSLKSIRTDQDAAMKLSTVSRCIDILSDSLGKMPFFVYDSVSRQRVPDHDILPLLAIRPNRLQSAFVFRKQMEAERVCNGNGIAWIQRDPRSLKPTALFPIPSQEAGDPLALLQDQALALALDGVQDPGNLGTIIRIADWFGISTLICSDDTVDAWNPKVVQATMGSLSRVNIIYTSLPALLDRLPGDYPVYGTFLDGKNIYAEPLTPGGLIIMGNEGNGISDEVRQRVNRRLLIPDFHQGETADSLNVAIATAITCSEFRRRGSQV